MTPFRIIAIFIFVSICGIALIPDLSVDLNPAPRVSAFTVTYSLPGAPPDIVEAEATAPIENTLAQLTGIEKISSVSNHDKGSVEVRFIKSSDLDFKRFEIVSAIRNLYPKLNPSITYPVVENRASQSREKSPLLIYSVNADLASYQIDKVAKENLVTPLLRLDNIEDIILAGSRETQLVIAYDLPQLIHKKIQPAQIASALEAHNIKHHFQNQKLASENSYAVNLPSGFKDLEEIRNIQIYDSTHNFRLRDLASVYLEEQEPRSYQRINGHNSITFGVYVDEGVNRIVTASGIKDKVAQLAANLPAGMTVLIEYDDTEFLRKEIIKNYQRSALALIILFLFVVMAYRNLSSIMILLASQFITLSITALLSWIFNISVHLYTLAGLSISFGLIIDNSIVMLDHLQRSKSRSILRSIIGATVTTIAALLLVLLLPDEERLNLTEFCLIVSISLGASVLTSAFFIPAAFRLWSNRAVKTQWIPFQKRKKRVRLYLSYERLIFFLARHKKKLVAATILCFGLPVFLLPVRWGNREWYNNIMGSKQYQDIRPWIDKSLGGSLRLFIHNVYERSGYREAEKTKLYVNASLPKGFSVDDMNSVMLDIEAYLNGVEGVEKYITHVFSEEHASITILFKDDFESSSLPYILKSKLVELSLDRGGVEWNIYGVGTGFSNATSDKMPSFLVEMKGYNYDELKRQADVLAEKLLQHPRIQKVDTDERRDWREKRSDQLTLNINSTALANKNSNAGELVAYLKNASPQKDANFFVLVNNTETPVYLQHVESHQFSKYDAERQSHQGIGKEYPMATVASITTEEKMGAIYREDRQYIRTVGFEYFGNYKFGNDFLQATLKEMDVESPAGYTAKQTTLTWDWEQVKRQYSLIFILIVAIYLIGGVLFESLKQPLLILTTIPVSFIGLFLSFGLFGFYFDQGGYAAFILLGGLTINAAIFITDDYQHMKGRRKNRNFIKATWLKATTVLLTIVSTIAGLLPFIVGGENEVFWFSLAIGTTGGLVASLYAVFILSPALATKPGQLNWVRKKLL